jgi:HAD superfamily hydrolase (TIGR01490 family)
MHCKQNLIFFDVDKTLIKGQSQNIFLNLLREEGLIPYVEYVKITIWFIAYKFGIVKNTSRIRQIAYKNLENVKTKEIDAILNKNITQLQAKIYIQAKNLINEHKIKGDKVVLISASTEPIINLVCKMILADDYLCTKLEIENERFTGKISKQAVYGSEKLKLVKLYLENSNNNFNKTFFYTDHISDIDLLQFVDIPICVNPDNKLKKIAIEKRWKVVFW